MSTKRQDIGIGKLPPQAIDLEEAILGKLMSHAQSIFGVVDILKPEIFYKDQHQLIYNAIVKLYHKKEPTDIFAVMNQLKSAGELELVGGLFKLTELTNLDTHSFNLEYFARIIIEKYMLRELIKISSEIINKSYDDRSDALETVSESQRMIYSLMSSSLGRGFVDAAEIVPLRLKEYEKSPIEPGLTGIGTGISDIDSITSGWQNSELIILAARPSMGKTAFALHCVRHAAIQCKKPVGFFSLEMSTEQIVDRLISAETSISMSNIKKRDLPPAAWLKIQREVTDLLDSKIIIDDTPAITVGQLRAKATRMKQEYGIEMLVVDYLGLMKPDEQKKNSNRTNDIGEISRGLKQVAKELDIPLIALSQLSRAVENRPGGSHKPRLSDLRDSGDIEQDADIVMFLYRPEYYNIDQDEDGQSTENKCLLMIEKNRNGELGTPNMTFESHIMQFSAWNQNVPERQMDVFDAFGHDFKISPSGEFDDDKPF
jgi:replicative DNA helicase